MKLQSKHIELEPQQQWLDVMSRQPFSEIEDWLTLTTYPDFLSATRLNQLLEMSGCQLAHRFVCQQELGEMHDYYETIIYKKQIIPTRPNSWHDLFNGLVWLQYPKTKALLNTWHVEDITTHGLAPRTPRRNHITHFDECGIILALTNTDLAEDLREHKWQECLHTQRAEWGNSVQAFVFGHANYEMMLAPFIGLTGKWLAVEVEPAFFTLPFTQQIQTLDTSLHKQLSDAQGFLGPMTMSPLPLLGIPGWWAHNTSADFYANQSYFRPARTKKSAVASTT
ncbi:MAG: hypothetical protein Alis3KO_07610 [Aliiglaciecola sp.]